MPWRTGSFTGSFTGSLSGTSKSKKYQFSLKIDERIDRQMDGWIYMYIIAMATERFLPSKTYEKDEKECPILILHN